MEMNRSTTVYNYVNIPFEFTLATDQEAKTIVNAQLECIVEPVLLKKEVDVEGFTVTGNLEVLAVRLRGSIHYLLNVPIQGERSRSYVSFSNTIYMNERTSLAQLSFKRPDQPVTDVQSMTKVHATNHPKVVLIESTLLFPDFSKIAPSNRLIDRLKDFQDQGRSLKGIFEQLNNEKYRNGSLIG